MTTDTHPTAAPGTLENGVIVQPLNLPAGARRIWRDQDSGAVIVRDIDGFGPRGHLPVGYVAEGIVIPVTPSAMTVGDIEHVGRLYAAYPDARPHLVAGACSECS